MEEGEKCEWSGGEREGGGGWENDKLCQDVSTSRAPEPWSTPPPLGASGGSADSEGVLAPCPTLTLPLPLALLLLLPLEELPVLCLSALDGIGIGGAADTSGEPNPLLTGRGETGT